MNRNWESRISRGFVAPTSRWLGVVSIGLALMSPPAVAQIVPDATLGSESSRVSPNVNIKGAAGDRIDGGAVRGSSLFHSFSEFNVNAGQRVYFRDPAGIANILTRVTGLNVSNILGTLGVEGGANLFLLNPNGILFGPNAQLDIQGSFVATTARSFQFADGSEFSATNPQAAPLLTMSVTPGVQYGTQPLGEIKNAGNLAVGFGQTLALYGGDVTSTGSLSAPGGTVMMLGDRIGLLDNARINVSSQTGGGTVLIGGGLQGKGAVPNATRTFVDAGVRIEADALTTGNGGNVIVWADEVTGFYGNISARGGTEAGNGGFVEVSGKQNLIFRGAVNTSASQGNSGTLLLDPENITIVNGNGAADGNQLNDSQILQGDGGASSFTISENTLENLSGDTNVILQATNDITVEDLTDNSLVFQVGSGSITFTADADGNGVGSFLMQDTQDTLYTNGRNIEISGASLTFGNINTFSISNTGDTSTQEVVNVNAGGLIPATGTSGTASFYFTIPDYLSTYTISDLNVRFSAEHTWDADLDVSLISPGGTSLNLFSRVGGSGDHFQDTLLDDQAATSIDQGTAPFTGSFKPVESLNQFNNQNPTGNWTLTVTDKAEGDSGRLFKAGETAPWGIAQGTQLVFQLVSTQPVINPGDGKSGSVTLNATNGNISAGNLNTFYKTANDFSRNGGAINLNAGGEITINSLNSSSSSSGNGGAIALTAQNNIQIGSLDASTGSGSGGNISITSLNGEIKTNNSVRTATNSVNAYDGGKITFEAKGNITIDSYTRSDGGDKGESGEINITSETGNVTVNNTINSLNYGKKGGDINITALAGSILLTDKAELTSGNTSSATGDGGEINITTESLYVTNSEINTSTSGQGNAGNVTIKARDTVSFDGTNSRLNTTTSGTGKVGNGGDININTGSLSVTNGAQLNASTQGSGQGGNLSITARNPVTVSGNGQLLAETSGTGKAGDVSITAEDQVALTGGQISTNIQAGANVSSGQASNITIQARNLSVTEGGKISASVNTASVNAADPTKNLPAGQGDAGNIRIDVKGDTRLSGDSSRISNAIEAGAVGQAGSITLNTGTLTATGGASIDSSIAGTGKAGDINLNATGAIAFSGVGTEISSEVKAGGNGQGGNISLSGASLTVDNGAKLSASTSGQGNGGDIDITARNSVTLSRNGQLSAETTGSGRAGSVKITTPTLNVNSGAQVSTTATASATGQGGNLTVNANTLNLSGKDTALLAETQGDGKAGSLTLQTDGSNDLLVNLAEGAQISASTSGTGLGGNLTLNIPNSITLSGDGKLSAETTGSGQAGKVTITTPTLNVNSGAQVSTTATEKATGNGGDINVSANTLNLSGNGSGLFAETKGAANAGNLTLQPNGSNNLLVNFLTPGAQVSASTSGSGTGGNLNVTAPNSVTLIGDGKLSAETTGSAQAGKVQITTPTLAINRAQVSTSTSGSGTGGNLTITASNSVTLNSNGKLSASASDTGKGGNITIDTGTLKLDQGTIQSQASKSQAGDINLTVKDILWLSHNSLISTTAGTEKAPGDGGNIKIQAPFIIALPSQNSDIIANAFTGNGGQIYISANRVFGMTLRNRQSFDTLRQNSTNDLSASSQSGGQGTINIQSLSVDPSQGLADLPTAPIDPSNLIAKGCGNTSGATANRQSEFVVTGRGGLPPSPDELQTSGAITPGWVTRAPSRISRATTPVEPPTTTATTPIVEAQGLVINDKGELLLTAQAPTATPHLSGLQDKFCSPTPAPTR